MKTGVYICHCGSNIAGTVDCAEVARWAAPQRAAGSLQLSLAKGYELGTLKRLT